MDVCCLSLCVRVYRCWWIAAKDNGQPRVGTRMCAWCVRVYACGYGEGVLAICVLLAIGGAELYVVMVSACKFVCDAGPFLCSEWIQVCVCALGK